MKKFAFVLAALLLATSVADARPLVGGRLLGRGLFGRVTGRGLLANIRARVLANRLERAQIRGAIVAQNVINANVVHAAFRQRVFVNHQFAFNAVGYGFGANFVPSVAYSPPVVLQPAFVPSVQYAGPAVVGHACGAAQAAPALAPAVAGPTTVEAFDPGTGAVRARVTLGQ